jgi:hypothetical protein
MGRSCKSANSLASGTLLMVLKPVVALCFFTAALIALCFFTAARRITR